MKRVRELLLLGSMTVGMRMLIVERLKIKVVSKTGRVYSVATFASMSSILFYLCPIGESLSQVS